MRPWARLLAPIDVLEWRSNTFYPYNPGGLGYSVLTIWWGNGEDAGSNHIGVTTWFRYDPSS